MNHKIRNLLILFVDVSIFVSSNEFSENIRGETEKSSVETNINVMAPPAPPAIALISIHLQQEPSDLQALEAVKAELIEETSQSSLMSATSGCDTVSTSDSFNQNVVQHCAEQEEGEKMDIGQSSMMVAHQPLGTLSNDIIELQIKQEIARRGSLSPQDEYSMLGVENAVSMNPTSHLSTGTMFPQTVPSIQTDIQKSQMLMNQYQTSLVAATTAQLSLHSTQDVLMRSSDNIMDTNMAPTIMVPNVHSGLESVNPILSTNVLASDTNALHSVNVIQPTSQEASSTTQTVPLAMEQDPPTIAIHERTSPAAVKTMILNVAAEILSSPEQPSAETQSTINALIALDTEKILNGPKIDTTCVNNPTASAHHNLTQSVPNATAEFNSSLNLTGSHLLDKEIR